MVERGVYRVVSAPPTNIQRLLAAVLRCGEGARATGWSSCAVHELEGFPPSVQRWIAVPVHRQVVGTGLLVQRTTIAPEDRVLVRGVPTVSPRRALMDAAIRVRGRRLRVAIDDARRRNLLSLEQLLSLAGELHNHSGAAAIRQLFCSGTLDQDGEIERILATGLASRGVFPLWSAEVLPGIFPDATMPEAALIVECDGRQHHTLPADVANDASREGLLRLEGWEIIRTSGRGLVRNPGPVIDRIVGTRRDRMAAGLGFSADWRPLSPGRRLPP